MKTALGIFLAIACLSPRSGAAQEKAAPDSVVVRVLETALPHEADKRPGFLWTTFGNKPDETRFASYTTDAWKDTFAVFAKTLVRKANDQKLDADSLRKVLDLVLKDSKGRIAYLPVGAYQTTLDGNLVWIVTVKWESPSMGKGVELGHIRMFAFDQKKLKRVGFETCM